MSEATQGAIKKAVRDIVNETFRACWTTEGFQEPPWDWSIDFDAIVDEGEKKVIAATQGASDTPDTAPPGFAKRHFGAELERLSRFTPDQRAAVFYELESRWCWDCGKDQTTDAFDHSECL